jgi:hypothetical protein
MVKSNDVAVSARRDTKAQSVITHFGNQIPDFRLLCFFDDGDWQPFKDEYGAANRGFYAPLTESPLPNWPDYVRRHIFVPMSAPKRAFDHVIYLYGSTCSNDVGLALTFSHELQHFVQHGNSLSLWAANTLIPKLPKSDIEALGLTWCDIPHEREARIVSKRIAENLFGTEVVTKYIDAKIAEFVTKDDADDWKCIRGLVTSTPYDLAGRTKCFFRGLKDYRPQLENVLRCFQNRNDPDFKHVDLNALLNGTSPLRFNWQASPCSR